MTPQGARALGSIAVIVGLELAVSLLVLRTGFVAISDDDFSRVVIAERFVAAPSLDPSGSSWLPLPFLILGSMMAAFGRNLAVARAVAVTESAVALILVYQSARWLSLSERGALASAAVAAVLPTAACLGVSFQPEALTAGLVLAGAASTSRGGLTRLLGGAALGAATLCRYEAWAAALAFAILCIVDRYRSARRDENRPSPHDARSNAHAAGGATTVLVPSALVAILPGALWMLHGALSHGSALFFFDRVTAYRRAIGGTESIGAAFVAYPAALVQSEPELVFVFAGVAAWMRKLPRAIDWTRAGAVLAAVFVFLVIGRVIGGAPTHHDERPLLAIFWALGIAVSSAFSGGSEPSTTRSATRPRILFAVVVLALCGIGVRLTRSPEPFAERRDELAIGAEARRRLGDTDRLLVDSADYGYFAVIAAFGAPERAEPFDRHDPRDPPTADAFRSREALASRLVAARALWFVAPNDRVRVASSVGTPIARRESFTLFHASNDSLSGARDDRSAGD